MVGTVIPTPLYTDTPGSVTTIGFTDVPKIPGWMKDAIENWWNKITGPIADFLKLVVICVVIFFGLWLGIAILRAWRSR